MKPPRGQNLLVAASALTAIIVGLFDLTICRRCQHPRHQHRHDRAGTDCSCGCRRWTLIGTRHG